MRSSTEWVGFSSAFLCLATLGCGSSTKKEPIDEAPPASAEPVRVSHVINGKSVELSLCDGACKATRLATCEQSGKSWQFELVLGGTAVGEIHVSDAGLLRLDFQGSRLVGIDTASWLACRDECPGTAHRDVCFPYVFPLSLNWDMNECPRATRAGPSWNGMTTEIVSFTCPDVEPLEITVVPDLKMVRESLTAVGLFRTGSTMAGLEGLPVRTSFGDAGFELRSVRASTCDAFAPPDGWEVHDTIDDHREMLRIEPAMSQQMLDAATGHQADLQRVVNEVILEKVAAKCFDDGVKHTGEEVTACIESRPEVAAYVRTLLDDMQAEIMEIATARIGEAAQLMDTHYTGPLCDHFASRR